MTAPAYSLAAWRKYREEQDQPKRVASAGWALASVPVDAEMDDGILIGFWNGQRFVSWEEWIASAPILRAESTPALPEDARLISAVCGTTRVWLALDGDRWLMFVRTRKSRRKDFASPFLEHAIRSAEAWYGPAAGGWQVEQER